jgi:hypothetical protein
LRNRNGLYNFLISPAHRAVASIALCAGFIGFGACCAWFEDVDRMSHVAPRLRALAVAALVGGAAFLATPAQAWWHGGFFIGVPPVVVAPVPAYYPPYYYPPAYYPPAPYYPPYAYPPAYGQAPQAQPQAQNTPASGQGQSRQQVAYGSMCYAGIYQCAAPNYTPIGQTCSCPGLGAPSFGSVR